MWPKREAKSQPLAQPTSQLETGEFVALALAVPIFFDGQHANRDDSCGRHRTAAGIARYPDLSASLTRKRSAVRVRQRPQGKRPVRAVYWVSLTISEGDHPFESPRRVRECFPERSVEAVCGTAVHAVVEMPVDIKDRSHGPVAEPRCNRIRLLSLLD